MPHRLDPWMSDSSANGAPLMGLRWQITRSGEFIAKWPPPGLETSVLAMGWMSTDGRVGIIEHPPTPVDIGVLEILEERFPGRRWFAGCFNAPDPETSRAAA